jgi:peptidyl-prolyl cis-trans isomerase SurA
MITHKTKRAVVRFILCVFVGLSGVYSRSEIIDRLVAVVNEEVITLTDVRIAEAFGLYAGEVEAGKGDPRSQILEKLIDQKVVIQLSREVVLIKDEELDGLLMEITQKLGPDEVERRLTLFGLGREDLKSYIRKIIRYQAIISRIFSRVNPVSVKEIEDYYQNRYIPAQKKKNVDPQPLMEILDEIETRVNQEKNKVQIEDWIEYLREKSDIQITKDGLKSLD